MNYIIRTSEELNANIKKACENEKSLSNSVCKLMMEFIMDYKISKKSNTKLSALCFEILKFKDKPKKTTYLAIFMQEELMEEFEDVCNAINMNKNEVLRALMIKKTWMHELGI